MIMKTEENLQQIEEEKSSQLSKKMQIETITKI